MLVLVAWIGLAICSAVDLACCLHSAIPLLLWFRKNSIGSFCLQTLLVVQLFSLQISSIEALISRPVPVSFQHVGMTILPPAPPSFLNHKAKPVGKEENDRIQSSIGLFSAPSRVSESVATNVAELPTNATLIEKRLWSSGFVSSTEDYAIVKDEDYPSYDTEVIDIKTLIWECTNTVDGNPLYFVTACRLEDQIDMIRLGRVLARGQPDRLHSNTNQEHMVLAPKEVAERLTSFESGTMPPILHRNQRLPLYLDQRIATKHSSASRLNVSMGSGFPETSLVMKHEMFLQMAEAHPGGLSICEIGVSRQADSRSSRNNSDARDRQDEQQDNTSIRTQRTLPKDRLDEYRRLPTILDRALLFRTTCRRRGRFDDAQELVQEALRCNEFPQLLKVCPIEGPDRNALHMAAWKGDLDTIKLLLDNAKKFESSRDVINRVSIGIGNYGKTPIFFALTQCREKVIRYLLQQGASLLFVNNKGQTPCSIAGTHVSKDLCELMYRQERAEIMAGGTFVNYRETHSDGKLYGDLDPRFGLDTANSGSDLDEQLQEYHSTISTAQVGVVPTDFSPRSLRPTTRWWNRPDGSLAAANNEKPTGVVTFTQARPRPAKPKAPVTEFLCATSSSRHSDSTPLEISKLPRLTWTDIWATKATTNQNFTLIDSIEGIKHLHEEIESCLRTIQAQKLKGSAETDMFLYKHSWGLDCEWQPGVDCGKNHSVETLQLSSTSHSFVIDLRVLLRSDDNVLQQDATARLNESLGTLFTIPDIAIIGFGIKQDLVKLVTSYPDLGAFQLLHSVVDLPHIVPTAFPKQFRSNKRNDMSSLQKMVGVLMHRRLDKTQQTSAWQERPLTEKQLEYAAMDAALLPLLLEKLMKHESCVAMRQSDMYRDGFFKIHHRLRTTIRFTVLPTPKSATKDEESADGDTGDFFYEVPQGTVKSIMGIPIARQIWSTGTEEPELPKKLTIEEIRQKESAEMIAEEQINNRRLASRQLRKASKNVIMLQDIPGSLDRLPPRAGMHLGYTKDSCVNRVIGHNFLQTLPDDAYVSYSRRGGVVSTLNAFLLFANFGGVPSHGRTESEFSPHGGRRLSFGITPQIKGSRGRHEFDLYQQVIRAESTTDDSAPIDEKQIILFARPSTKSKYIYCGFCNVLSHKSSLAEAERLGTVDLDLELLQHEQLVSGDPNARTPFEEMVQAREELYRNCSRSMMGFLSWSANKKSINKNERLDAVKNPSSKSIHHTQVGKKDKGPKDPKSRKSKQQTLSRDTKDGL